MVDRNGLPLALVLTWATVLDSKALIETIDALQPVRPPRGRPRKRPRIADKGYDYARRRRDLRTRGIIPASPDAASKQVSISENIGEWSTFAWFNQFP